MNNRAYLKAVVALYLAYATHGNGDGFVDYQQAGEMVGLQVWHVDDSTIEELEHHGYIETGGRNDTGVRPTAKGILEVLS